MFPSRGALRPIDPRRVRITGGFWAQRQAVNGTATIEHCRTWLDRLGWTGNFATTGTGTSRRRGREFSDSEVYKHVEAMCWESVRPGGTNYDARLDELTAMIAGAQAADGYLHTAFGRPGQPERYSDLNFGHELYCAGHLIQAGVAAARTGRADGLLDVARRAADHICDTFADAMICGHPEIETALVELFRVTGDERYLDQATRFVDRRGHRSLPEHEFGWRYFQDAVPVRDGEVFHGHSVRALYLAAGAVDVAVETGDDALLGAVAGQFERTLARRTYITGGMGSRHLDESFGDDFVLPPDRAYSETCAGVATVMLAHRLLLATGDMRYGDIVDRVLHNVIATAVADDGRAFFYANTLHQRTPTEAVPPDREQLRFGGGPRAPWFEVSCCLNNVARLLASLGTYLVTEDDSGVQVHHYAPMTVEGNGTRLTVSTDYPEGGSVVVTADTAVTLRVPAWAHGTAPAQDGDQVRLELPMKPRWTFPDPRVDATRGCAAVEVGPVVMCAESVDQEDGVTLDDLQVDTSVAPETTAVKGRLIRPVERDWPYHGRNETPESSEPIVVTLVPYHRWARRGPSTMRIWLPTATL
ncbi:glycoside hydrolase family 127 protein [Dactylosporangium sp. NBC_01737]|uniref:glycoside hydrolase family 127 protein n=1 Tax=Dactylosporangium sp. NBC_01737 TaxID=2975959 RepID=UPI002E0D89EE|nr:glycoside hydrolase family 127 protein [Dactylosporangium sp. NBC_01737]